jgi:hypothetical protein
MPRTKVETFGGPEFSTTQQEVEARRLRSNLFCGVIEKTCARAQDSKAWISGRPELRQLVSDLYPFTKYSPREPLCLLLDNEILLRWFSVFQFTRISAGSFACRSELLELKDQLQVLSCRSLKGIPEHKTCQQIRPDWTILKMNKDSKRGGSRLFSIRFTSSYFQIWHIFREEASCRLLLRILILDLENLTTFQRLFPPLRLLRAEVLARQLYLRLE